MFYLEIQLKTTRMVENHFIGSIVVGDIVSILRLKYETISYLAQKFEKLDLNNDGFIDYKEFCIAFNIDPILHAKQMKSLFKLFETDNTDSNECNVIDFNQFLVGVSVCFMDDMIHDASKLCSMDALMITTMTMIPTAQQAFKKDEYYMFE